MVAAGVFIDPRRAAEFRCQDDERRSEQAALLEILDQRAHRPVELRTLLVHLVEHVAVHVPAAKLHLDAPHPRFDQPPREQAAEPDLRVAVAVADLGLLLGDVKGLQVDRAHQPDGVFVELVVGVELPAGIPLFKVAVDAIGQRQPAVEVLLREIPRPLRVFEALQRIGHRHGRERGIEEAGAWMVVAVADEHVAGKILADLAHGVHRPRPERRMPDAVDHRIARPHQVLSLLVGAGLRGERADHGQAIGQPGEFLEALPEDDARRLRGNRLRLPLLVAARLGVEGVEVAHRALHHQIDDVLSVGFRTVRGGCQLPRDRRQEADAERCPRDVAEHLATGDRVEPVVVLRHKPLLPSVVATG